MGLGWNSNGLLSNPAAAALLADTDALNASGSVSILISSSVLSQVTLEYRNVANTTTIWSHTFFVAANSPVYIRMMHLSLQNGERLRLKNDSTLIGSAQGSIFVE